MTTRVMLYLNLDDARLVLDALERHHPIDLAERQRREQIITTINDYISEEPLP